jgi:hypothetical protein
MNKQIPFLLIVMLGSLEHVKPFFSFPCPPPKHTQYPTEKWPDIAHSYSTGNTL